MKKGISRLLVVPHPLKLISLLPQHQTTVLAMQQAVGMQAFQAQQPQAPQFFQAPPVQQPQASQYVQSLRDHRGLVKLDNWRFYQIAPGRYDKTYTNRNPVNVSYICN